MVYLPSSKTTGSAAFDIIGAITFVNDKTIVIASKHEMICFLNFFIIISPFKMKPFQVGNKKSVSEDTPCILNVTIHNYT